ncbi:MAG TPA: hypothetical protein VNC50_00465, partial [Planctomycetia bacterium]|nr:hypothetical protein [Planctomycetia bacterium]
QSLVADLSIGLFRIIADAANHVGEERFDAALAEEMTESFDIPLAKEMSDHGDDFRRIPAFRILQLVRDGDEANAREIALTAASRSPLAAAWFPHAASLRAIDRLLVQAPVTTVDDETLAALEKRCTDLVARIDAGF